MKNTSKDVELFLQIREKLMYRVISSIQIEFDETIKVYTAINKDCVILPLNLIEGSELTDEIFDIYFDNQEFKILVTKRFGFYLEQLKRIPSKTKERYIDRKIPFVVMHNHELIMNGKNRYQYIDLEFISEWIQKAKETDSVVSISLDKVKSIANLAYLVKHATANNINVTLENETKDSFQVMVNLLAEEHHYEAKTTNKESNDDDKKTFE